MREHPCARAIRRRQSRLVLLLVMTVVLSLSWSPGVEAQKLKLASSVRSLFSLPLYVANNLGWFKEAGLDVEIFNFRGGAEASRAILGGSTDMQAAATENMFKVIDQGQPMRALMNVQGPVNGGILVSKSVVQRLGRKPTVNDLKGLRIATLARGGLADMLVRYVLTTAKLDPDRDAILKPILGFPAHIAAMKAGEIDGTMAIEPFNTMLVDTLKLADYVFDILAGEGPEIFQEIAYVSLQARVSWLEKNLATAEKVVRTLVRAQSFVVDPANFEEVVKVAQKEFPDANPEVLRKSVRRQLHSYAPHLTKKAVENNNILLTTNKLISRPLKYEEVVDARFVKFWDAFKKK
ncbi:MAG: ABC transporter substrate-binding protein [Candidatus Tectomicrobia bacterium]|nr:ABC transporter substrate-binding protein [Candidatus Tectomicrobia bacterium]